MRSLLARLAALSAFAVSLAACQNGSGNSLPFAGPPNNAGGNSGTVQTGSNGAALLRFIQGSPDVGAVDVCVDNTPFGAPYTARSYGSASPLFAVAGGIPHTLSVYTAGSGPNAGAECATAPGPYFGTAPLAVTTLGVGNSVRWTIVLGGTKAPVNTFGLYVFNEPTFPVAPAGAAAVSHNAAPEFSIGKPNGVGFGICTTTATPCATPVALTGAQGVAAPKISPVGAAVTNNPVTSGLNAIPAGFYDGIGVPAGNPIPITSVSAPNEVAGQPYYVQLYAIDAPAGGLNLLPVLEQTLGYGF
ncbi:MAG TPA: hypothetical protein VHS78_17535 [Candidatus Elarobacter sp.]|jgi:hypothetical protein|nr:hypothetical protein [Candidatus Elarobacter sp.]